jgi:hypothetical protein
VVSTVSQPPLPKLKLKLSQNETNVKGDAEQRPSSNELDPHSNLASNSTVVKPFKINLGGNKSKSSLGSSATPSSFASTIVGEEDDDEIELGEIVRPKIPDTTIISQAAAVFHPSSQFPVTTQSNDQNRKLYKKI